MAEINKYNWVGVRPVQPLENVQTHLGPWEDKVAGTTRSQVMADGRSALGGVVIYSVTLGKSLYLCSLFWGAYVTGGTFGSIVVRVRNSFGSKVFDLVDLTIPTARTTQGNFAFLMPLKLHQGYDVFLTTTGADGFVSIQGWVE